MLLSQNFGRRHERALPTGVHADRSGQRCDPRLTSPNIALQQAVHRHVARHVFGNFKTDALLGFGQFKR